MAVIQARARRGANDAEDLELDDVPSFEGEYGAHVPGNG